ncbi:hypothetical protein MLD38_020248 [Melastoma candidum]|uniref:Uncharacterized protein n=1 Tax=Melastoma candidum TaxID=119954 RepID=A0ACB9QG39_9MYRT|nr:hypothetical protein MLD38_020248 [Melastoma candidum]
MGLSSLPAPSEGMLCILLVNAALSISVFKSLIWGILDFIGLHHPSAQPGSSDSNQPQSQESGQRNGALESYMYLLQTQTKTVRFDMLCRGHSEQSNARGRVQDCSVCLMEFSPQCKINELPCGHIFHMKRLEKWMVYWNITCPLCRSPFLPEAERDDHVTDL